MSVEAMLDGIAKAKEAGELSIEDQKFLCSLEHEVLYAQQQGETTFEWF